MSNKEGNKEFNPIPHINILDYNFDDLDEKLADELFDELELVQPYFLIRLFTYMVKINQQEFAEILKAYFLTWQFFRTKKGLHKHKVTKDNFDVVLNRQMAMVNYVVEEMDPDEIKSIYDADLDNIKSKVLFDVIISRFKSNPDLRKMDNRKSGLIIIDIKTFIECFDVIENF